MEKTYFVCGCAVIPQRLEMAGSKSCAVKKETRECDEGILFGYGKRHPAAQI